MTNTELRDAAWAELMLTEISGKTWLDRVINGYKGQPYNSAATAWGRADAYLKQIVNATGGDYGSGAYGG